MFIINQAMAQGLFGEESPLGRRIAQAGGKTIEWGEIVGVAGDVQSVYPEYRDPDLLFLISSYRNGANMRTP